MIYETTCKQCNCTKGNLYIKKKGQHYGLYCCGCDKWQTWIKYDDLIKFSKFKNIISIYDENGSQLLEDDINKYNNNYKIYTDGACLPNPGIGGWSAILVENNNIIKEVSGNKIRSTNNEKELTAILKGLNEFYDVWKDKQHSIEIYSDSKYCVEAFNHHWIDNWIYKTNWKTTTGNNVANQELFKAIYDLTKTYKIKFCKVKAHRNNIFNNRCDELAVAERRKLANY